MAPTPKPNGHANTMPSWHVIDSCMGLANLELGLCLWGERPAELRRRLTAELGQPHPPHLERQGGMVSIRPCQVSLHPRIPLLPYHPLVRRPLVLKVLRRWVRYHLLRQRPPQHFHRLLPTAHPLGSELRYLRQQVAQLPPRVLFRLPLQ